MTTNVTSRVQNSVDGVIPVFLTALLLILALALPSSHLLPSTPPALPRLFHPLRPLPSLPRTPPPPPALLRVYLLNMTPSPTGAAGVRAGTPLGRGGVPLQGGWTVRLRGKDHDRALRLLPARAVPRLRQAGVFGLCKAVACFDVGWMDGWISGWMNRGREGGTCVRTLAVLQNQFVDA